MATPVVIMQASASFLNDINRRIFTDDVLTPYLNVALTDLQEIFQLNNIPVTNQTSSSLAVAAGISEIAFTGTVPTLPPDLVEIRQLWESPSGLNQWTPMKKMEFLPHYYESPILSNQFLIWAWEDQKIKLIAANANNDLKLDYIKTIFPVVTSLTKIINLNTLLSQSYLQYRTAALAAYFIGENEERASVLNDQANEAMMKSLQISTKGKQAIGVRRRPFRAAFKMRATY
jgi:hypothetical protein